MATDRRCKAPPKKRALTDKFVKQAWPGTKRLRFWDTIAQGLLLQIEATGTKSFLYYYRCGNRARWFTIGPVGRVGLADARKVVKRMNAQRVLDPTYDPQAEKMSARKAGTFRELAERYLSEHARPKLKSAAQSEYKIAKYLLPRWGHLPVQAIRRADVRTMFTEITNSGSPVAANQALAMASGVFAWAIRNEIVDLPANPAIGIEHNSTTSRERVLSDQELPLFWKAFDDAGLVRGGALRMLLLTGQRPGEVCHLRREHIDRGQHTFTGPDGRQRQSSGGWWAMPGAPDGLWPGTKNGAGHRVWLTATALAILDELEDGDGEGFVFAGRRSRPVAGLDTVMRRVCRKLGITDPVRPHDLRRSHGTITTGLGFTRDAMNRIQNHKEGGIGSVYDRYSYADEMRRIQEAVAGRIMALVHDAYMANVVSLRAEK